MIRNQWYMVLDSRQVRSRPVAVMRLGEKMVFWRDRNGVVRSAVDRCPHRGAALSAGTILDGHLQCPFHGMQFEASGKCVFIPANGRGAAVPKAMKLQTYPTYEAHGLIWIWWGNVLPKNLPVPDFFADLANLSHYGSAIDAWQAHYSRVIENQLDVVHLPFVHHRTIGRGNRTLVDGPLVEWQGERMLYTYVFNRVDDGRAPLKPRQLKASECTSVHLEFIFPNLWQNHLSREVRILAAFVPVDEENTLLYLRFYHPLFRIPLLGRLLARLSMPGNLYIAHEDRRVVTTQQPKASGLRKGEVLIQGDLPIIEYRRRRAELQTLSVSDQAMGDAKEALS